MSAGIGEEQYIILVKFDKSNKTRGKTNLYERFCDNSMEEK